MSGQEDVSAQPLVIVRRRKNTEEGHHGGVWKIAYADFMTAMMAFFLVMWLINAADKKTIVQVAAYFNPIRLTDKTITPKGLEEMTEDAKTVDKTDKKGHLSKTKEPEKKEKQAAAGDDMDATSDAAAEKSAESKKEQALFDNPSSTLDKIADRAHLDQATPETAADTESDPFDRQNKPFRKSPSHAKPPEKIAKATDNLPPAAVVPPPAAPSDAQGPDIGQASIPGNATKLANPSPPGASTNKDDKLNDKKEDKLHDNKEDKLHDKKEDKLADKTDDAKKIETELSGAISQVSRKLPNVEVKATPEGVLISLTDAANFGMFEVGSAQPRPEMVVIMSKIGEILRTSPGKIVLRGHTDSRAYRSGNYDNWRLSAARAQMAYYMLVRGGVQESRVVAVEGRADRDPKVPTDTEAAQNRRIDILLKDVSP